MSENQQNDRERTDSYWKRNVALIRTLLIIWALVSLVCSVILGPLLNGITLGSLPLGFWFAQQGSIVTFVILIFVYCFRMDSIDKEFDVNE